MGAQHHGIWRDHSATRPPFERVQGCHRWSRWNVSVERWDTDTCQVLVVRVVIQVLKKQKSTKNTVSQIFSKTYFTTHALVQVAILHQKDMDYNDNCYKFVKHRWAVQTRHSPSHPFQKKRVQQTLLQPSSSRTCHGRRAPNQKNWGSKTGSHLMSPPSQGNFRTNFRKTSCGLDVTLRQFWWWFLTKKNGKIKTVTHKTKQTLGELATAAIQTEVVCKLD